MNYDLETIQKHVLKAIEATTADMSDYQYMTVENLFPREFFDYLKSLDITEVDKIVHEVFVNEAIVKAIADSFDNSPRRSNVIKSIYAFWQRHNAGYTLKPHVDAWPRVFTMGVYLADNNDHPEAGTAVYSVNEETREWETVGMMPFLENSCMIICPYDGLTWHGVDMLETSMDRDSVIVVFSAEEWNEQQLHYADWKAGVTVNYDIS